MTIGVVVVQDGMVVVVVVRVEWRDRNSRSQSEWPGVERYARVLVQ